MVRFALAGVLAAELAFLTASVCAADALDDSSALELALDSSVWFEDPCANAVEGTAPCVVSTTPELPRKMSTQWTRQEIDWLRSERDRVRLAGPSVGVGFSILGFAAGAWLLAMGVEGTERNGDPCSFDGTFCISRPAPYAGTVLMGLSVFGLVRAGKKLRERARKRRALDRDIHELAQR